MEIIIDHINVTTHAHSEVVNITNQVTALLQKHKLKEGSATIFVVGSTASITTTEYEPGLKKDIPEMLERLAPRGIRYHHDDTWGDGNGHAHLRSALFKTSLSIPVIKGELTLGTWQQVVLLDFDNRSRTRRIVIQVLGE